MLLPHGEVIRISAAVGVLHKLSFYLPVKNTGRRKKSVVRSILWTYLFFLDFFCSFRSSQKNIKNHLFKIWQNFQYWLFNIFSILLTVMFNLSISKLLKK